VHELYTWPLKINGNWHSAPLTAPLVVIHFEELVVVVAGVVVVAVVVVVSTTIPIVVVVDSDVVVVVVNGVVVVVGAAVVVGGLLQVCATADSLVLLQSSPEQHLPTRLLQKAPSARQAVYWQ